jgi:hypothetical protein
MSEYQFYEFRVIDKPLSADQMKQLRGISSRAEITPVSFINVYNWGDLQANPQNLMRDFFDVHVYLANWGSAVLMLRLPKEVIDEKTLQAFAVDSYFDVDDLADYWLLTWSLGESEDYERFDHEEGGSWMPRLEPLREELLRGDLRSLYIGWLQAVTMEKELASEKEPMALEGLGKLTAAQQALAEFLAVDPDLLTGAGVGSAVKSPEEVDATTLDAWLDQLPREEVRRYLQQMLTGQGAQAERTLRRSFVAWRSQATSEKQTEMCRTVEQLWHQAKQSRKERLAREAEARSKADAEKRQRREAWLTLLVKNLTTAWKKVHEEADKSCASGYDSACRQLVDLRDAYDLQGDQDTFQQEFRQFMAEHSRRKAFITRLEKAGLR